MNNNIPTIFNYGMASVRTVSQNDQVFFVASDICNILGISNVGNAVGRLDDDEVAIIRVADSIGRPAAVNGINESGLYNLIIRSDKAEAKPFRKWVTSVVLPTIRKTGGYVTQEVMNDPERLREMLLAQTEKVIEYEPKAKVYDMFLDKKENIPLVLIAKECGFRGSKSLTKLLCCLGLFEERIYCSQARRFPSPPVAERFAVATSSTAYLIKPEYKEWLINIIQEAI